jgi:hypothetical protein
MAAYLNRATNKQREIDHSDAVRPDVDRDDHDS